MQEAKKKETEEKKCQRKEEKALKVLMRKRPKRNAKKPVMSSSSDNDEIAVYDDESTGNTSSSSEFYEGSDSRCRECDTRFRGREKSRQSVVKQSTVAGGTTQSVQVLTSLARRRKKSKTYHSHANIAR